MSIQTCTVQTATKGKASQPFEYQAFGKLVSRDQKNRETGVVTTITTVDISEVAASTSIDEIAALYAKLEGDASLLMREDLFLGLNRRARSEASPTDTTEKVDSLSPFIERMVAVGVFADDGDKTTALQVKNFKTRITGGAELNDETRIEFLRGTKAFKTAVSLGADFSDLPESGD